MRMLSFDMKRKINTLRDILVGKVPDPKSQVEQITIAMVFKFMDDMDKEFLTDNFFGGQRKFFVDTDKVKYSKYSWSNIMSPQIGGQEKADLYREGIEAMQHNPNLPQFFRDVFRNAYIPFRDSETINLFLKEINDFSYDNSEDLGEAFEMLLSIMGSQGDAGQFRTPRHLIDMIIEIVQPTKTDKILDPACGTAGFLISAYKYILEHNKDREGRIVLTPDEKTHLMKNFEGYDISQDMVRLSSVNMYLHHFPDPKIHEYDTLTAQDRWDDQFDVIFANPPFMTPKGGIIPHNRFRVQAKRSEILFVDYIAEHLAPNGRAGIIVPEGIVFQSANAYKELRKYLVDEGLLYAVISLPAGVFNPYSGVKTSVLLIDRSFAKKRNDILFVKINNDGYDLGAQRRPIKENDIPNIVKIVNSFKNGEDVSENPVVTISKKEAIAEQDYILVGDRYKESIAENCKYPMVGLGSIFELASGRALTAKERIPGKYNVYGGNGITGTNNEYFVEHPTIAIGRVGEYCGSVHVTTPNCWITDNALMITEYYKAINQNFLAHMLRYLNLRQYAKIGGQPSISQLTIKRLAIPLPPLSMQEEIGAEIKSYQKIIDGAKDIINNYKPLIKVGSNWEIRKLGDVCDVNRDNINPEEVFGSNEFIYLDITAVENGTGRVSYSNFIKGIDAPSRAKRKVNNGSILLSTVRPNLKAFGYIDFDKVDSCVASTGFAVIDSKNVAPKFVYYSIFQDYILNQMISSMGKGSYPSINQNDVANLRIALPRLEIQQKIISQIDEEMMIVEKNRRLIEIFEQKIANVVNQVWTSDECESPVSSFPTTGDTLQYAARNTSDKFLKTVQKYQEGDSHE